MNQPGCVAAPPLEPMTSHAPSPSAKPPRTCVYSLPVFAPMVVSRTSGKPLIVGGSGPAFLRYRVICPAISGWRYLIRPHGVREPRVPRGVISSLSPIDTAKSPARARLFRLVYPRPGLSAVAVTTAALTGLPLMVQATVVVAL